MNRASVGGCDEVCWPDGHLWFPQWQLWLSLDPFKQPASSSHSLALNPVCCSPLPPPKLPMGSQNTPSWKRGFLDGTVAKDPLASAGDSGSISGLGRSPGAGNGSPLQYSCLENPVDRGAWWATVRVVAKSQTRLSDRERAHATWSHLCYSS